MTKGRLSVKIGGRVSGVSGLQGSGCSVCHNLMVESCPLIRAFHLPEIELSRHVGRCCPGVWAGRSNGEVRGGKVNPPTTAVRTRTSRRTLCRFCGEQGAKPLEEVEDSQRGFLSPPLAGLSTLGNLPPSVISLSPADGNLATASDGHCQLPRVDWTITASFSDW
jgi:hypothetical protein